MDGWVILADKVYLGAKKDGVKCIAAALRRNMKEKNNTQSISGHK